MGRIAGKSPVKAQIKKLVVTSKSFEECSKKIRAVAREFSDIEILRLWNRRSAFKKELDDAKPEKQTKKSEKKHSKKKFEKGPETDKKKMSEAEMKRLLNDLESTTYKLLEGLGIKITKIEL